MKHCIYITLTLTLFHNIFADSYPLSSSDFRIRDPYVYADKESKTYYLYAQSANREESGFKGVEVYKSKDLKNWSHPEPVLILQEGVVIEHVWAPEVHAYMDKYYLFVTLTYDVVIPGHSPANYPQWPELKKRGTHIFVADNPAGPFKRLKEDSHTPPHWMALDGTLWVEEETPYMIFCHEWIQLTDGTMDYVELTADLSNVVGEPIWMFNGSDAPGAFPATKARKITDGCFLYRSPKSDRLFMIWSTILPESGYCVVLTWSESGTIKGPWKQQEIMYAENGGHGMLFESFEGKLMIPLHQPNIRGQERLYLFKIEDTGDRLKLVEEVEL